MTKLAQISARGNRVERCECSDPGCAAGHVGDCTLAAEHAAYRADMDAVCLFCEACANDAHASGLFTVEAI